MNPQTAVLTILVGVVVACWPVRVTTHTFEQRWEPVKQLPPMVDRSERPLTFEERWEPVKKMPRMLLPDAQQDIGPRIIPVRTITIRPEPEPVQVASIDPVAIELARKPEPPEAWPNPRKLIQPKSIRYRSASLDLCQRHGLHKQVTRGGKSWRCRK